MSLTRVIDSRAHPIVICGRNSPNKQQKDSCHSTGAQVICAPFWYLGKFYILNESVEKYQTLLSPLPTGLPPEGMAGRRLIFGQFRPKTALNLSE